MTTTEETQVTEPTDEVLAKLMEQIASGKEQIQKAKMKGIIFGDPGTGKSVILGQAPNSIIVDIEKGLTSLKNHPDLIDMSKIKVLPYINFVQVEALVHKMNEGFFPETETLSIDSGTEFHKRGLSDITEREWKKNKNARNRFKAETEDHTENNEHVRRFVSSLRDLDKNILITCHSRSIMRKDGSIIKVPDFSEKLANALMGIMDFVGYMEVNEVDGKEVRSMRVRTNGIIQCKTRYKNMPSVIIDPTWEKLHQWHLEQVALDDNEGE